jgi:hypothetical protein
MWHSSESRARANHSARSVAPVSNRRLHGFRVRSASKTPIFAKRRNPGLGTVCQTYQYILSPGSRNWALLTTNDVTIKSPQRCVLSIYRSHRVAASLHLVGILSATHHSCLAYNQPTAVTLQCTTLAAHMKRKSGTLCHAEIPGILCSPLLDIQSTVLNAAPRKKVGES